MGSCNQCVQRQEPQQIFLVPSPVPNLLQLHHQMAIRIQTAFRAYSCRLRFREEIAKKRSMNQKRSNSTDDNLIEFRTNSYSPKVDSQEENQQGGLIKRKSLSHFGREHSMKMQPNQSDSFHDSDVDPGEQIVKNQSPQLKNMRSSQAMSKKMQSFRFRCVLTHDILEPRDKIKIQVANKRIKLDAIKLIGGNIYNGEWFDQLPDGKGKYTFSDASSYIGEFSKGALQGRGEFKCKDGAAYRGQWHNNRMHGQGIYISSNGSKYEGSFERDLPNGEGMEWYSNGSVYVGTFLDGDKHGTGKMTFVSGEVYEGQFEFDDINGIGVYRWQDGRVYEGEWCEGKMNGKGKLTWPDGRMYDGEYINDQKEGVGIFMFADGRKYIGNWKDGLQHGEGQFFKGDAEQPTKGIWKKGKLIKLL